MVSDSGSSTSAQQGTSWAGCLSPDCVVMPIRCRVGLTPVAAPRGGHEPNQ